MPKPETADLTDTLTFTKSCAGSYQAVCTGREFYFDVIRAGSIWTLNTMRRQDGKASTVYRVDSCATLAAVKDEAKALNRRLNRAGT